MASNEFEADVVVIGGGGAGLSAASEAARLGRSVILLEKNPKLGGSTAWAIGSVTAINTPHQLRAGIKDSPDEHFEDLEKLAGALAFRDNLVLRRILVEHTTEMFDWLLSIGVVFMGPMLQPPHRYPRMHNVVPNSSSFPYHLGRHCRRLGVDLCLAVTAKELIVKRGRVTGVIASTASGEERRYLARRAVVLASGDFSGGRELKARYASGLAAGVDAVNATNTGDGHRMALGLGASVINGDLLSGPDIRFVPPERSSLVQRLPPIWAVGQAVRLAVDYLPAAILRPFLMSFVTTALGPEPSLYKEGAILVNAKGERFADELGNPEDELVSQPEGIGYIVLDGEIARRFAAWPYFISTAPSIAYAYLPDYKRNRRDIYHEAGSVELLARRLGMSPETLSRTVRGTAAPETGRRGLIGPNFVALGPIKSYVTVAEGGLKVSEHLEVLGPGDTPIPGLFAGGATGQGGLLLYGHGHHLAWAFVSGRLAGRNAALNLARA